MKLCFVCFSKAFCKRYVNLGFSIVWLWLFYHSILSTSITISFYIFFKRLFLGCKWLSDAKLVSISKREYGLKVHFFLSRFIKYLKSISDEWLNVQISCLFGVFSLKFFGTVKNKIV